ncbi:putative nitrilase [Colletotrichum sp. SAR 10_86]|nr:putative nitrilase [Colletotrichum sp. SAR 10_86]KAI8257048.1 putative nitrilase [Colletotrichum sp. SAR 10_77]
MSSPSEPRAFKVALVQTSPKVLDAEHNFNHASKQIRRASAQGASLAVLPEYHLMGWVPDDPSFALSADDAQRFLRRYQDLAAELHINICAGTIVSDASTPKPTLLDGAKAKRTLLNTSYFIDHDGQIVGAYTKTNLWIPERQHLTSSVDYAHQAKGHLETVAASPHQVFNTPLGPVGSFTDGEEDMRVIDVDMRVVEIAEQNYQIRKDLKKDNWHYGYNKGAKL